MASSLRKPFNIFSFRVIILYMYAKVLKMTTFGGQALQVHVWMISAKGIKPKYGTVSVYTLLLFNLD